MSQSNATPSSTPRRRSWLGLTAAALCAALLLLPRSADAGSLVPKIKKNHMVFDGIHYFRAGASGLNLSAWGEKKTPVFQANYMDKKGNVPLKYITKVKVTTFDLKQVKVSKTDFKASVNAGALGKLSVDAAFDALRAGTYKFVLVEIDNKLNKWRKQINDNKTLLSKLKNQGKSARIVTSVIIVESAKIVEARGWSARAKYENATLANGKVTFGASGARLSSYTLAPGTVFAYLLDKIEWDAKLKKNQTKIVDFEDDQHGPY